MGSASGRRLARQPTGQHDPRAHEPRCRPAGLSVRGMGIKRRSRLGWRSSATYRLTPLRREGDSGMNDVSCGNRGTARACSRRLAVVEATPESLRGQASVSGGRGRGTKRVHTVLPDGRRTLPPATATRERGWTSVSLAFGPDLASSTYRITIRDAILVNYRHFLPPLPTATRLEHGQ